jgi:hypothetical protein
MGDTAHDRIIFVDWKPEDFEVILEWIYSGRVSKLNSDNMVAVWEMADFFVLSSLLDAACSLMERNLFKWSDEQLVPLIELMKLDSGARRLTKIFYEFVILVHLFPPTISPYRQSFCSAIKYHDSDWNISAFERASVR